MKEVVFDLLVLLNISGLSDQNEKGSIPSVFTTSFNCRVKGKRSWESFVTQEDGLVVATGIWCITLPWKSGLAS